MWAEERLLPLLFLFLALHTAWGLPYLLPDLAPGAGAARALHAAWLALALLFCAGLWTRLVTLLLLLATLYHYGLNIAVVARLAGTLRIGATAALCTTLTLACSSANEPPARPSILLVVLDTTRLDAVSAYGEVAETTPTIDQLAREGLLYRWAMAPSPWTLPSHATLFTSLGPEEHRVGLNGRMALDPAVGQTLAERLQAEGYETVGFSENSLISDGTGLLSGFEIFFGESHANWLRWTREVPRFDAVRAVEVWSERHDASRPFFLFVNLFDPHDPYEIQEQTRLPEGVEPEEAVPLGRGAGREAIAEFAGICDRLPPPRELEILRSLYLGEVSAADAKLHTVLRLAREAAGGNLLTVVTADHGEHLGEHRLLGHEFSLHAEVLRVPLVVHGLDEPPAEIEAPVGLEDLAPSILAWVGAAPAPGWQGHPLPTRPAPDVTPPPRALTAFYDDTTLEAPKGYRHDAAEKDRRRLGCADADGVFGDIRAVVHFPYKRIDYARRDPQVYDLRWDRHERSDLWSQRGKDEEILAGELGAWKAALRRAAESDPKEPVDPKLIESLRALGYAQ